MIIIQRVGLSLSSFIIVEKLKRVTHMGCKTVVLTVSEHSSWRAALPGMQDQLERVRAAQRAKFLQTWNGGDGLVGREQRWQAPSLTEGDSVSQRLTHAGLEGSLVSTVQGSCVDPRFPPWAAVQGTAGGAGGWHTTGLFPQDLVLAFSQPVVITKIELETWRTTKDSVWRSGVDLGTGFRSRS